MQSVTKPVQAYLSLHEPISDCELNVRACRMSAKAVTLSFTLSAHSLCARTTGSDIELTVTNELMQTQVSFRCFCDTLRVVWEHVLLLVLLQNSDMSECSCLLDTGCVL